MVPLRQSQGLLKLLCSEYARAVQQMIAAQQLLEATVASLDVGIVVEDTEGRVLTSNPAADRILPPGAVPIHEDGWPLPPDAAPAAVALRTCRPCTNMTFGLKQPDGS